MYYQVQHKDPKQREHDARRNVMAIGEVEEYYLVMIPTQGSIVYAVPKADYEPAEGQDGSDLI